MMGERGKEVVRKTVCKRNFVFIEIDKGKTENE